MTAYRLRLASGIVFLLVALLAVRLTYIQIFQGISYSTIAQRQYHNPVKEESFRGDVLDRDGCMMATTAASLSVFARPKELSLSKHLLDVLSRELDMTPQELSLKLDAKKDFVWISRKLDLSRAKSIAEMKLAGLGTITEQKRVYPNADLACHVLGAVGLDNRGLSGIERSFDSLLAGRFTVNDQVRDAKGRRISMPVSDFAAEPAGGSASQENMSPSSIVLSIDRSLQYAAEKEIRRGVEEYQAESGMALIQNPRTGEILAMASYPSFDPNQIAMGQFPKGDGNKLIQNPAVCKMFEPGSTFKIVSFAAGLEEKKVTLDDTFYCEDGKWKFAQMTINDHEGCGTLTLSGVMEKSSNIGTAKIGLRVGRDKLYEYARAFGFGSRTGLPMGGEIDGKLRSPAKWSQGSVAIISFGQEIGVSALQVIGSYSVIANGGALMEPLLIKEIRSWKEGGPVVTSFAPQRIRQVISPETAGTLRNILKRVVECGTGTKAKVPGYSVAGKTGTAQKMDPRTKKYSNSDYLASFCGFLPADNPELVCLVVLDKPKKDYWGGSTAAPVFARIMSRAVQVLGLPPERSEPQPLTRKTAPRSRQEQIQVASSLKTR